MEIAEHARTPMLRWCLCDTQLSFTKLLPPFKLVNRTESQARNDIADILGNNNLRSPSAAPTREPRDGTQRRPVQVIEVSVAHQHIIDGGQIAQTNPRTTLTLQHDQPAGKVRIDHEIHPADLNEETAMPDERNPELAFS